METFFEAQEITRKFRDERDWAQFHTPDNLAKSISLEAAELLELFQWARSEREVAEIVEKKRERISEELADVLIYCLMLANALGMDAGKIIEEKLAKSAIKYPVSTSKGLSTKYDQK